MDLRGEEKELRRGSCLGYNNPSFRELPDPAQFPGAGEIIELRSSRYSECLRNHAANVGGNVLDGCCEFMPSGDEGTPEALRCAACNCHRNFHRREADGGGDIDADLRRRRSMIIHPLQLPPPFSPPKQSQNPSVHANPNHWASLAQPVKIAFGGSTATDSSSEDLTFNGFRPVAVPPPPPAGQPYAASKKRFRSKFTAEQKEKMLEFAEKVGWRIPKEDDVEAQRFCGEVGVKRQVFKVWMHNNKMNNSHVKKQEQPHQEEV